MVQDTTSLLFVCHANLCRSPLAERLTEWALARRLAAHPTGPTGPTCPTGPTGPTDPTCPTGPIGPTGPGIVVGSAGTHAYVGDPMHRRSLRVLAEYGADTRPFFSRRVDEALLDGADLILTANREQRAHCVRLSPGAIRRTFTLREFGRLCGAVDPARLPGAAPAARMLALVDAARAARSKFHPVPARDDDLADPVTRPLEDFQLCARDIMSVVDTITGLVMGDRLATGRRG